MQKFINDPATMTQDSLRGFVKCHEGYVEFAGSQQRVIKRVAAPQNGRVGVVAGGGYGHDPAFVGFVGDGMLDAAAVGNIFAPPKPQAFATAFRAADGGVGVLCILGNFPKDIASAQEAVEVVKEQGISVKIITVHDDIATENEGERRGSTGEILVWKVAGAAAAAGLSLEQTAQAAERAAANLSTIGVGLASCIIPEVGRPNYQIEFGTMEMGVSHHGMSSMETYKLKRADEIAPMMLEKIQDKLPCAPGDRVCVMMSGLGNTMMSELNILYSGVYDGLKAQGIRIERAMLGDYFTSLDMMGATLTILKLDDELWNLLKAPAYPAAFSNYSFQ